MFETDEKVQALSMLAYRPYRPYTSIEYRIYILLLKIMNHY